MKSHVHRQKSGPRRVEALAYRHARRALGAQLRHLGQHGGRVLHLDVVAQEQNRARPEPLARRLGHAHPQPTHRKGLARGLEHRSQAALRGTARADAISLVQAHHDATRAEAGDCASQYGVAGRTIAAEGLDGQKHGAIARARRCHSRRSRGSQLHRYSEGGADAHASSHRARRVSVGGVLFCIIHEPFDSDGQ